MMGLPGRIRSLFNYIFSGVYTMHQREGRTDIQTDGHRTTAKTALTHSVAR